MNETLTPSAAARVLTDAAGFERALERRTAGITMMVWGIANSAIFSTYGLASVLGADKSPHVAWIYGTLWIPWVLIAMLTTLALWRSAALSSPHPMIDDTRDFTIRAVGLIAAISLAFFFIHPDGPTFPLAILGSAYALVALVNLFRSHPDERRFSFAAGIVLVAIAGALALVKAGPDLAGTISILAPLFVLGGLGFWQTMRG